MVSLVLHVSLFLFLLLLFSFLATPKHPLPSLPSSHSSHLITPLCHKLYALFTMLSQEPPRCTFMPPLPIEGDYTRDEPTRKTRSHDFSCTALMKGKWDTQIYGSPRIAPPTNIRKKNNFQQTDLFLHFIVFRKRMQKNLVCWFNFKGVFDMSIRGWR